MRKFLALSCLLLALVFLPVCSATKLSTVGSKSSIAQSKGNPSVRVWVNTDSSVYHCPGTRWYGNTKQGEYATQKQAQDAGNRPAYGKYCG